MSGAASPAERSIWTRLPAPLRPRSEEGSGSGQLRLVETTLLLLAALLLAIATVNDVARQAGVNHRLAADLHTWRAYTRHDYRNLTVAQDIYGHTTREIVCGNTTPGGPKERVQLCLVMTGPVVHGLRSVRSGWYLPPKAEDVRSLRYRCFGRAREEGLCPR
jgi:hypothetical protein